MLPKIGFIYGNDTEEVNIKIVGTMKQPEVLKEVHKDSKGYGKKSLVFLMRFKIVLMEICRSEGQWIRSSGSVFHVVTKQKRKDLNSQKVNKRFKLIQTCFR